MPREAMPDYVKISVDAVGGPTTAEGQEMKRLLLEREEEVAAAEAAPKPAALAAPTEESILPAALEAAFETHIAK